MRNSIMVFVFSLTLLMLVSCGRYTKESDCFNEVLKVYGISIPDEKHCYVVIPVYSCHGCVQKTWLWLKGNVSEKPNHSITVIDCNKKNAIAKQINCEVHFDTLRALDNVCFDLANPTIVKTIDRKITTIISIDSRYIDEMLEMELKEFI